MKPVALLLALLPFCLGATVSEQIDKFAALAAQGNGVIKLDERLFYELIAPNREWSTSIQLTALGNTVPCAPCREFNPVFNGIGKAWTKVPEEHRNRHFFATLDFADGQDVFRALGLNTAPVLYSYNAIKGPHAPARAKLEHTAYDFANNGFELADVISALSRFTPVPIPYTKPLPWAMIFSVVVLGSSLAIAAPYIYPVLASRWTWAAITISIILIMIGGQMFVRIRGQPYAHPGQNGALQWIVAGFQTQMGMEVHVVAAIYGLLSLTLIALNTLVPRVPSKARQKTGVFLWTTVLMVTFSGLVALFRVKNQGYPFRLFF